MSDFAQHPIQNPKFLFIAQDHSYACVVTLEGISVAGLPIIPSGHPREGDECELVGRVGDDTPAGPVDLTTTPVDEILEQFKQVLPS